MIQPIKINPINFGYKSILKTLFKEGKLPSVKVDIYGKPLVQPTVEHILPKSKGGKSKLFNYALANLQDNMKRGSDDIIQHTTVDNIRNWYNQFIGVKLPNFDGDRYIEEGIRTFKKLNIEV